MVVSFLCAIAGNFLPDRWTTIPAICVPIWCVSFLMYKRVGARLGVERRRLEASLAPRSDEPTALVAGSPPAAAAPPQAAPVLYLRSFDDDRTAARLRGQQTEEESLASVLGQIGPFIAVGRPGEPLPEVGATRMYLADAEWQGKVESLLQTARLVVIRTGRTASLGWEVSRAARLLTPERLLLVVDDDEELAYLLTAIATVRSQKKSRVRFGWRSVGSIKGFIAFDPNWQVITMRIRSRGPYENQGDISDIPRLARTLHPIFRTLGARWVRPRVDYPRILCLWIAIPAFAIWAIVRLIRGP
jgi:hypothetical protein